MRANRRAVVRRLVLTAALTLSLAGSAAAQVGISAELASDARFRGRSVSENQPIAGLDLSYDAANGAYAGASGQLVATAHHGVQPLTLREYAGFARRLDAGPTLDFGVTHAAYTEYSGSRRATQYSEVYTGLAIGRVTTRLSYSPSYFGTHLRTLYGEIDSAFQPARDWRVSLHAGALAYIGGAALPPSLRPTQYDWRVGLATVVRSVQVELAWSGAGPDAVYGSRSGVALELRRDF